MTDKLTADARSRVMAAVKSRETVPELLLRRAMWGAGLRGWRLNVVTLPGKPDIVFPKARLAVFVDGCFWHGCKECYRRPESNQEYWDTKVRTNVSRDRRVDRALSELGWIVRRFWEHEVRADALRVALAIKGSRDKLACG